MPKQNLGPHLKRNGYGLFEIAWTEQGRSKRRTTWTANLSEAQRVLSGFLIERDRDAERKDRLTVGDMIDFYDTNHVTEKVVDKERQRFILAQLKNSFGDFFPEEIGEDEISRYRTKRRGARRATPGVKKRPISDPTIRRELATLIGVFNFAVRKRKLDPRLAPTIDLPAKSPARDVWLEREEAAALLDAAQKGQPERLSRAYRFVAIALGTAKRKRAIETLKWFQVDFKRRLIDFRKKDGSPETKKRRNVTPISDWLLPILERAFNEKTSEFVLDHEGAVKRTFETAVRNSGVKKNITPHTLRHTWGTWAAQAGKSMWEIAGVMGCSVQTAEANYLHHSPEHLRYVVDGVAPAERKTL